MPRINILFTRSFKYLRIGGVTIYVKSIIKFLNKENFNVINLEEKTNFFKNEFVEKNILDKLIVKFNLIIYMILFPITLCFHKVDIVHSNPSLLTVPIIREAYFIVISFFFRKKIVVTFHGWDKEIENVILSSKFFSLIFSYVYNLADVIYVLSNDFKNSLLKMGIKKEKIIVETTMIDESPYLDKKIKENIKRKFSKNQKDINILFLARVEKDKGIYETIDAIKIINERLNNNNINLFIAGDGSEINAVKNYVQTQGIKNIKFLGYVTGEEKIKAFLDSDIYVLFSYHEGLPISVLEAMYFGLPIVTRKVGGLKDFFIDNKHGSITESKEPIVLVELLEKLILDKKLRKEISYFNYNYAREKFIASKVVKRLEKVYLSLTKNKEQ